MKPDSLAILFCLSLSDYPVKPDDISAAEPTPCPLCGELMWFSVKKKEALELCQSIRRDVLFCCSRCLIKKAQAYELGGLDEYKQINL